jgi:hypothetical protein
MRLNEVGTTEIQIMRVLEAAGISISLAILAISGVLLLAAIIGLLSTQSESNADARRKFRRMDLFALLCLLLSGAAFWWLSRGATISLFRY